MYLKDDEGTLSTTEVRRRHLPSARCQVAASAPTPRTPHTSRHTCARAPPQVTANFINGKPRIVKGVVVMKTEGEWDRFMRFMERYGQANGLGFAKA